MNTIYKRDTTFLGNMGVHKIVLSSLEYKDVHKIVAYSLWV